MADGKMSEILSPTAKALSRAAVVAHNERDEGTFFKFIYNFRKAYINFKDVFVPYLVPYGIWHLIQSGTKGLFVMSLVF